MANEFSSDSVINILFEVNSVPCTRLPPFKKMIREVETLPKKSAEVNNNCPSEVLYFNGQ